MDYQFDVCFLKKAQSSVPSGIRASVRHAFQPELSPRQKRQHLRDLYTARRSFGDGGERYSLVIA
jgi:hypothetical protein